jgi:enoyl-CoA hydratase/carnithine racemase
MLLLGQRLSGQEAAQFGLATRSFPDAAALDAHIEETLQQLHGCSPTAYKWIKRCLAAAWDGPLAHGLRQEVVAETETMASGDFLGALTAYADQRPKDYWTCEPASDV